MRFEHILMTTDLSELSRRTLALAERTFLRGHQGPVTLLWVRQVPTIPELPYVAEFSEGEMGELKREGIERLRALSALIFGHRPVPNTVLVSVDVAGSVVEFAKRERCDLIVAGSHGAGALATLLMGSTIQQIIQRAPCPVVVIPHSLALSEARSREHRNGADFQSSGNSHQTFAP